jgi:hypothetical protein
MINLYLFKMIHENIKLRAFEILVHVAISSMLIESEQFWLLIKELKKESGLHNIVTCFSDYR